MLFVTFQVSAQGRFRIDDKYSSRPIRSNELTLAGIRPGSTTLDRAWKLYPVASVVGPIGTFRLMDPCTRMVLYLENGFKSKVINTVRLELNESMTGKCETSRATRWLAGQGLKIGDTSRRVVALYGEPDSRSPSTKNGQPLELLHYDFGWAGPDVPQVMEVVCTAPKDGTPGRVVEITLAAGTL